MSATAPESRGLVARGKAAHGRAAARVAINRWAASVLVPPTSIIATFARRTQRAESDLSNWPIPIPTPRYAAEQRESVRHEVEDVQERRDHGRDHADDDKADEEAADSPAHEPGPQDGRGPCRLR